VGLENDKSKLQVGEVGGGVGEINIWMQNKTGTWELENTIGWRNSSKRILKY